MAGAFVIDCATPERAEGIAARSRTPVSGRGEIRLPTPTPAPIGWSAAMDAHLRPYAAADLDDVIALSLRAWEPVHASMAEVLGPDVNARVYPDWRVSQEADVVEACTGGSARVWVADVDGRAVGFVAVVVDAGGRTGEIHMVAVEPAHQGRGIGLALTELAIDHIRAAGGTLVTVGTGGDAGHAAARRLYERAGFTGLPLVRYYQVV
jgi:ribosomal protein S18 acetylase RimI-like enzyme